jgi:hypothetical protein
MPLRLHLMAHLDALGDVELQQFASRDLRSLIARKQPSVIAEVYRQASKVGKHFIEQTVADIYPSVVELLRAGGARTYTKMTVSLIEIASILSDITKSETKLLMFIGWDSEHSTGTKQLT